MPVNRKLMRALKRRYGSERGERVYYALEMKRRRRGRGGSRRR